jgi:hypothetical protein
MNYKGYFIQESEWFPGKVEFFLEGGKSSTADSIEEAKDLISEKIMNAIPPYKVETVIMKGSFALRNITKKDTISEAIEFAVKHNGIPLFKIQAP